MSYWTLLMIKVPTGEAAYKAWVASPVRDNQNADALRFTVDMGFGADEIHTVAFDSLHHVSGD